jgi:hypothetical protein
VKIEVTCIEEHEDGSASCKVDLDQDGMRFLINLGLMTALNEAIANHKELEPYEPSDNEVSGC